MSAMDYVGLGAFYIGVPARDLTEAEATQHAVIITGSPLYEAVVGQGAPAPASAPAAKTAEAAQEESAPTESASKRRKGE